MTDDEKDKHIKQLEVHMSKLETRTSEMHLQVKALHDLFMVPDPMSNTSSTRAKRIMDVVNAWESGSFAVKWGVRIVLTLGGLIIALKGLGIHGT